MRATPGNLLQRTAVLGDDAKAKRDENRLTIPARGGFIVAAGYEDFIRALDLNSLDSLFRLSGAETLHKNGLAPWRERLRLATGDASGPTTLYIKRFREPPRSARREVRRSRTGAVSVAGLEWAWILRLRADGLPCPQPVALGEELHAGRERRSAIVTAAVPGRPLEAFVREWGSQDGALIRSLLPEVAALVARLHRLGYIHRDLYLSHIFYDSQAIGRPGLCLIDLLRVFRPRWRKRRWIVKDLAALDMSTPRHLVSRTQRVRWLLSYLGQPKFDSSARRLARRIVAKSRQMDRRHQRRTGGTGARVES